MAGRLHVRAGRAALVATWVGLSASLAAAVTPPAAPGPPPPAEPASPPPAGPPVEAARAPAQQALSEAIACERAADDACAAAAYARALDADPALWVAAKSLVRLRVRGGDAASAEREARERLARSPDSGGLHDALAEALLAQGRLDDAEQEARKALKLDERNVPAMVTLATAYHQKKRHELARMVLENARQVDARDAAVWNRLGLVELSLGNRDQALEHFKTAAALAPEYPEAHANHGALLADAGDWAGAAAELELAVRFAPRSAAAWLDLGNVHRGARQFEKAEAAYQRALELDPGLADARLDLALLYLDGEKPGTATLARLERALAHLDAFEKAGGSEPRLGEYRRDATKAIERERKRLAREERDQLRRSTAPAGAERTDR